MKNKLCQRCKKIKTTFDFYKDKTRKDGFYSYCKECTKFLINNRNRKNPEKPRNRAKEWTLKNKDRARENTKNWLRNNKEKVRSASKEWSTRNRSRHLEIKRKWWLANKEKVKETSKAWLKKHPEKRSEYSKNRRALKIGCRGKITTEQWNSLKKIYDNTCLCCKKQEPEITLTLDHIVPLIKGGENEIKNAQPLCKSCNSSKHTKTIDFRPSFERSN